jgi:hypothetical protein
MGVNSILILGLFFGGFSVYGCGDFVEILVCLGLFEMAG